ncbi:hypothetical protein DPMN_089820 [Dreissena polymorpha]|uniref:Uncharacterized protein n=1 Tax=Dreissena polymorpha TaxID=45954 RepID=A0A9D4KYK2_DREPO|nr:hypothetical protein DPMN_056572 [Dreissena polymorpha]KAH3847497.1 hypothetical protein DPMN_089820 [Dreissena polymorpha]
MMYTPITQELTCGCSSEFRAYIRGKFIWYSICHKDTSKTCDQSMGSVSRLLYNGPVGITVHYNKDMLSMVAEILST